MAIVPAAHERLRSGDTPYEFRQDSDFLYLTGFAEPDAVLVLAPHHDRDRSVMFLRARDRTQEIWTGKRLGAQAAPGVLGVDAAYSIDEFDERLPHYLNGAGKLYYELGRDEAFDRRIHQALANVRRHARRKGRAPEEFIDPGTVVHEMRLYKDPQEIEVMRRAAAITALGHRAGMAGTRPGLYEYEIEAAIESEYFRNGAQAVAYPSIVAGGENATILHYDSNRERLHDGDLLLVDSGSEFNAYASDVTRTWPISGRFSPEQRAIYEIVLAAQEAGVAAVKPGAGCRNFHDACVRVVTEGLIDIGLLSGTFDENIETQRYYDFFMHGSGHWLGLDVHDVGRYRTASDTYRVFEPGMVTTVEPGIYVHRDIECDERFKGIGVRIEDNILVTSDGNENFNTAIPKSIAEIEALVGETACA